MATGITREPPDENESGSRTGSSDLLDTEDFTVFDLETERPEPHSSLVSVDFEAVTHPGASVTGTKTHFWCTAPVAPGSDCGPACRRTNCLVNSARRPTFSVWRMVWAARQRVTLPADWHCVPA